MLAPEPSAVHIKRIVAAELGAFKNLRDESLRLHPDAFDNDIESVHARPPEGYVGRLGLGDPLGGTFLLGAWEGPCLVGVVGLERQALHKLRHSAELTSMTVRPSHRGRGVGDLLMAACITQARCAIGLEQITLRVSTSSHAAIRVYERAGFQHCGVVPHAIKLVDAPGHARYFDKLTMVLML